jgi:hypothetical protein
VRSEDAAGELSRGEGEAGARRQRCGDVAGDGSGNGGGYEQGHEGDCAVATDWRGGTNVATVRLPVVGPAGSRRRSAREGDEETYRCIIKMHA